MSLLSTTMRRSSRDAMSLLSTILLEEQQARYVPAVDDPLEEQEARYVPPVDDCIGTPPLMRRLRVRHLTTEDLRSSVARLLNAPSF